MKVIFICTGNTCRSPMAKYILMDKINFLINNKGFSFLKDIKVISRGIYAKEGDEVSLNSKRVILSNLNIDVNDKAKSFSREDISSLEKTLILTMGKSHKRVLEEKYTINDLFTLYEYTSQMDNLNKFYNYKDVKDPYGGDLNIYQNTYDELEILIGKALDRIIRDYY